MDVFMANRSCCCVDMDQMCSKRQSICKELHRAVVRYYKEGYTVPIGPNKVFDADVVQDAFRCMQKAYPLARSSSRVIEAAPKLKGVLQMSMILRGNAVSRMSYKDWTTAIEPKIQGTWNLHRATANYASANAFLDSFFQYRTELGLPAFTVDIGDVTNIGVTSGDEGLKRVMKLTGAYEINEQELLDAIAMSMTFPAVPSPPRMRGPASTFVTHSNFVVGLASATPFESAENRLGASTRSSSFNDSLNSFLDSIRSRLRDTATANTLARKIGKKLLSLIMKPKEDLVTSTPLADLGMDSLVAIEMRTW
ncbi:hypothetical protein N0V84_007537 [Fusarium piperis]|uniref:Carrier domain-containing protein n=1 Tax=Fusarium piperis TaxID=1435070 RepID=A0A9W9BLD2_9HYPO|nr:hypothetical protein N0V84_007537 [Fusarium piperis]